MISLPPADGKTSGTCSINRHSTLLPSSYPSAFVTDLSSMKCNAWTTQGDHQIKHCSYKVITIRSRITQRPYSCSSLLSHNQLTVLPQSTSPSSGLCYEPAYQAHDHGFHLFVCGYQSLTTLRVINYAMYTPTRGVWVNKTGKE